MAQRKTKRHLGVPVAMMALLIGFAGLAFAEKAPLTDQQISNAIDWRLIKDSATPADDITVATAKGIVTLNGSVDNIMAKDRAEAIAETVKGVRAIVNRIVVTAPFRSDTDIEKDVKQALIWDPATESWEISATVKDGVATLNGTVDSWQEKTLAGKVVKGVRGVKGIENNIAVDYATQRSDAEIREEIKKTLRWDVYLDDALIDIDVKDGKVTLTGTVGSLAEKSRAWTDAWVAGVKAVDNSDLQVEFWARDEKLRKDKFVSKSDAEIETAVRDAFLYDPRVSTAEVTVDVSGGIATLRGTVDDLKEKRAAAVDARNVVGVWAVKNQLKVKPDKQQSDSKIEENVESALVRNPYVDRYQITVSVVNGEVYLYGDVNSAFEKGLADDVAARQKGVKAVHNFIDVKGSSVITYDPYIDSWDLHDYEWYTVNDKLVSTKTDWEIERNIKDELFWSPFVDADQVKVEVDNGVAELTGTVDTWSEREAAGENALEGGALIVDNDLAVSYGPDYYRP